MGETFAVATLSAGLPAKVQVFEDDIPAGFGPGEPWEWTVVSGTELPLELVAEVGTVDDLIA